MIMSILLCVCAHTLRLCNCVGYKTDESLMSSITKHYNHLIEFKWCVPLQLKSSKQADLYVPLSQHRPLSSAL